MVIYAWMDEQFVPMEIQTCRIDPDIIWTLKHPTARDAPDSELRSS